MAAAYGPNPSTAHGMYNATPPTVVDGQAVSLQTDVNGNLKVTSSGGSGPVAGTGTVTSVNDTASDTTILAANSSRRGASVFNESTGTLYLLLGAGTSSATNYTVQLSANAYYEVPFGYTGIIKGIWSADASGAARVTEFTA